MASGLYRIVRPQEFEGLFIPKMASRLVSEFLGTYFLVITVGFNVLGGSKAPAFSIAASLMCMIYALGNISGAHFNPAVTVAVMLGGRGKIEGGVTMGLAYIAVQLIAGFSAGCTYAEVVGLAFALGP